MREAADQIVPGLDEADGAESPRRRTGGGEERSSNLERNAIGVLVVAAALSGLLASGQPTTFPVLDAVFRAAAAATITLAASQAKRWTWLVYAGAVAALSHEPGVAVAAWSALAIALLAVVRTRVPHPHVLGAAVGVLAGGAMLRLPAVGPHGTSALVATVSVLPLLVSAVRAQDDRTRQRLRRAGWIGAAFVGIGLLGFGIAVALGASKIDRGIDEARAGVTSAKRGEEEAVAGHLREAVDSFSSARAIFASPLTWPARVLPVLSYQVAAMQQMSATGDRLATTASDVSTKANYRSIAVRDGRIELDKIEALGAPLAEVDAALVTARTETDEVDTAWLVPPLAHTYDQLRDEVAEATHETRTAIDAVAVAPAMLGRDGPRHYFVAFTTPAESRGLGGFMGNWAELTADDGRLELTKSGRSTDLAPRPGDAPRVLDAPLDYVQRYGALLPEREVRDITSSPDFPSVAQAIESVYPQTRVGRELDGVIALDPYTLAAMLRITGPVQVDGYPTPLEADNAAEILLRRQYVDFAGDDPQRLDFLDEAARKTFDAFIHARTLRPARLATVLGPLVEQGRLVASSRHPQEQALIARIGMDGAFPYTPPPSARATAVPDAPLGFERQIHPDGNGSTDFFAVTTQNAGNNKMDVFLTRRIDYHATFDPGTGAIEATATITLHNDAPSSGLPPYVIRNREDSRQPDGVNWTTLSLYSPLRARSIERDGQPAMVSGAFEFGLNVYDLQVAVPSGGDATVVVQLSGTIAPSTTYRVGTYRQPTVNPDELTLRLTPRAPWTGPARRDGEPIAVVDGVGVDLTQG